jgi:hypothetical protein
MRTLDPNIYMYMRMKIYKEPPREIHKCNKQYLLTTVLLK